MRGRYLRVNPGTSYSLSIIVAAFCGGVVLPEAERTAKLRGCFDSARGKSHSESMLKRASFKLYGEVAQPHFFAPAILCQRVSGDCELKHHFLWNNSPGENGPLARAIRPNDAPRFLGNTAGWPE